MPWPGGFHPLHVIDSFRQCRSFHLGIVVARNPAAQQIGPPGVALWSRPSVEMGPRWEARSFVVFRRGALPPRGEPSAFWTCCGKRLPHMNLHNLTGFTCPKSRGDHSEQSNFFLHIPHINSGYMWIHWRTIQCCYQQNPAKNPTWEYP